MNKNVFVFTGEEDFLLRQKVADWKQKFLEKHQSDINLISLDASSATLSQIMAECSAAPFLGDKRLVFIENMQSKFKELSGKDAKAKKASENLYSALNRMPESTVCVFVMPQVDKRTAFYKFLQKNAQIEVFSRLEGIKLQQWIQQITQSIGCRIDRLALKRIEDLYTDTTTLWTLNSEIQKCGLFVHAQSQSDSEKIITSPVIEEVVPKNYEAQIFDFTDAIGNRNVQRSLQLLSDFIQAGEDIFYLFHMLVRHFRILTIIYSAQQENSDKSSVCKDFGIHPYAYSKMQKQVHLFDWKELLSIQQFFIEIDEKIKQGKLGSNTQEQAHMMGIYIEKWIIKYIDKKFDKKGSFLYTQFCS